MRKLIRRIRLKVLMRLAIYTAVVLFLFLIASNALVDHRYSNHLYSDVNKIPSNKVGLLLGTSKYLRDRQINFYYVYRLDAAEELYESGKINFILISGDNGHKSYNEPSMLKKDLIKRGIPASKIFLDYAGFRTLDSVIRCREIFGQHTVTIISQPFHNERAVFIARSKGMKAIGFNAKDVNKYYGFKTQAREKLARGKMVLDLIFNKQPKFLGKKIII